MNRTYKVTVRPRSAETTILKEEGDHLTVAVHASPENGKANLELIKFLSKYFDAEVKILRGLTSRKKTVLVNERT
ncbi:MAG: DUF167 domain-containing protein [Nanoarchaeota archaeon]